MRLACFLLFLLLFILLRSCLRQKTELVTFGCAYKPRLSLCSPPAAVVGTSNVETTDLGRTWH